MAGTGSKLAKKENVKMKTEKSKGKVSIHPGVEPGTS
jgi:hypothetical protein